MKKIKTELLIIISLIFFTFITRVINLLAIPIFTDEAIYIRWAQIGLNDPAHRYISLTDGKQPLLTWLIYPFLMIFDDPLYAARFVSVFSGIFSVIGIYLLSKYLFGRKVAIWSSSLYILSPFTMVYDKLAVYDSLVGSIGIWSLYLTIKFIKDIRLDLSLLLGFTIGLGYLTKSSAMFFILYIFISLIIYYFPKYKNKKLIKLFFYSLISVLISLTMFNSLRLSPWFYIIELKNYTFIYSLNEFIKSPFRVFLPNLNGLISFLYEYLTIPITLLILWTVIKNFKSKKILLLLVWFLFPFISLSLFGRVLFPRFILFMTYSLFIIGGYGIFQITENYKNNFKKIVIILMIFIYPISQSFLVMINPVYAQIPRIDRNQLFDDWPSGWGMDTVINYLSQESRTKKIIAATEGTFGLNPYAYEIYLKTNPNIEIISYWPVTEVPEDLLIKAKEKDTYLLFKESQNIPTNWPLKEIFKIRRGLGNTFLLLYQVIPE